MFICESKKGIKEQKDKLNRQNVLKNIAYQIIIERRFSKRRNQLKDLLKKLNKAGVDKKKFVDKLVLIHGKSKKIVSEDDLKYDHIMQRLDRVQQNLDYHSKMYREFDNNANRILRRRYER